MFFAELINHLEKILQVRVSLKYWFSEVFKVNRSVIDVALSNERMAIKKPPG